MCKQIYDFAIKYGATMKFNATVTFASLNIMNQYINKSESKSFPDLMKEFPLLLKDFKGVIKQYYSGDIFRSPEAKTNIIQPDLESFEYAETVDR